MPSDKKGNYTPVKTAILEESSKKEIDLDYVLVNELGQLGRFQLFNVVLAFIPIFLSASLNEYIFGAAAIPHRCRIPECGENSKSSVNINAEWVKNAIPTSSIGIVDFTSCQRFQPLGNGTLEYCPIGLFNQSVVIYCESFVYARNDSVVYDFDLGCQEYMRALAGTASCIGSLLAMPIVGYLSDRWGRRAALVFGIFNIGLFGCLRAFSVNYPMYLVLQLLQTTFGSGTFSSSYIFATELVGPKWRGVVSASTTTMFATGTVIFGASAWAFNSWRLLLMIWNIPCFLVISYFWIMSKNIRWLLSKDKFEEAERILKDIARVNGTSISNQSMAAIMSPPPQGPYSVTDKNSLIKIVFKSRVLLCRVITTPVWWITTTFVYYGLYINSTSLSDQMHLNFILTAAVEIPGNYFSILLLDRVGRKPTICGGFALTSVCNIAFAFIPIEMTTLRLLVFLLGKFGIAMVFTGLYLYTSELYPTEYRHTFLGFSSMVGRIGAIVAPFTPVLMRYWTGFPAMLFGVFGLLSCVLVMTQPETLGTKIPDTIAEAEALGTKPKENLIN